jgi:hypothetical protein
MSRRFLNFQSKEDCLKFAEAFGALTASLGEPLGYWIMMACFKTCVEWDVFGIDIPVRPETVLIDAMVAVANAHVLRGAPLAMPAGVLEAYTRARETISRRKAAVARWN